MSCKVYVAVTARFDIEGQITPLSITWEDGHVYEIDRVLNLCRAASLKGGGLGMRYTCRIGCKETHLWLDGDRWFVEKRARAAKDA